MIIRYPRVSGFQKYVSIDGNLIPKSLWHVSVVWMMVSLKAFTPNCNSFCCSFFVKYKKATAKEETKQWYTTFFIRLQRMEQKN